MKRFLALLVLFIPALAHADPLDTRFISQTPTVSTAPAYSAIDTIGSLLTFAGACNLRTNHAEVIGVQVFDKSKQGTDMDLVLFSATPAGTFTDNAAFAPSNASMLTIVAVIPITTHKPFSANGISQAANIIYPVVCSSTDHALYGYLVSRGTPTYSATADLTVQIEVLSD